MNEPHSDRQYSLAKKIDMEDVHDAIVKKLQLKETPSTQEARRRKMTRNTKSAKPPPSPKQHVPPLTPAAKKRNNAEGSHIARNRRGEIQTTKYSSFDWSLEVTQGVVDETVHMQKLILRLLRHYQRITAESYDSLDEKVKGIIDMLVEYAKKSQWVKRLTVGRPGVGSVICMYAVLLNIANKNEYVDWKTFGIQINRKDPNKEMREVQAALDKMGVICEFQSKNDRFRFTLKKPEESDRKEMAQGT